ncbi:DUF4132 domain-containing protein [Streptomyces avicenniae]|uniref:DUF4132 domain-containing protein n=1 Tax=Streptomyces avicenniae TaxID=500153 RepID=UPI00069AC0E6|nr:DUF4132 domain-containing protein [Streptomyces avicenniae]
MEFIDRVRRFRTAVAADALDTAADLLLEAAQVPNAPVVWDWELSTLSALPADVRGRFTDEVADRLTAVTGTETRRRVLVLFSRLPPAAGPDRLAAERVRELADAAEDFLIWEWDGLGHLAHAELDAGRAVDPAVVAAVRRSLLDPYHPILPSDRMQTLGKRLTEPVLNVGEPWAEHAMSLADGPDDPWLALLRHLTTATAAKPTVAWRKVAAARIEAVGQDRVLAAVKPLAALVGRPRTVPLRVRYDRGVNELFDSYNAVALRGLAWLTTCLPPHPDVASALGVLVEAALRKIPGTGPRNPKVANAAVLALSRIEGDAALAEMARLTTRVTARATARMLDGALESRAAELGITRDDIEELAVPTHGLAEGGRRVLTFGEATAHLEVQRTKAVLTWRTAAGRVTRSVPVAVRRDHAEELKALKSSVKDIDRTLRAQGERLDRLFLARRTWSYAAWRERYLDHPLVGTLARRLLWTVDGETVCWADGGPRTLAGDLVSPAAAAGPGADGPEVALWHPAGREPAETAAWRAWLEERMITQPFKQAHREVYPLTDAERATGTYSNRFAAHVLRQHQFHSLAAVRGWRNKLRLAVDDEAPPATRDLPRWGLRAEFWIEADSGDHRDLDLTDSGAYARLVTDQVRFYPIDAPRNSAHCGGGAYVMRPHTEPLALESIPPLVLSEVLRDVDLFVGVASVGNDPTWQDGGPGGRHRAYWASYGFGTLSESARTRRALLERLVPRLAIADRCTLDGHFLQVKGSLHTYRIHLGSANIMIIPDDRYLCVVPKADGGRHPAAYLPFEGDGMLSVILSKAFLLADDAAITDPTILSQL